jgi:hypothetical protein
MAVLQGKLDHQIWDLGMVFPTTPAPPLAVQSLGRTDSRLLPAALQENSSSEIAFPKHRRRMEN